MTSVELRQISKRFGNTLALEPIDLKVEPGELLFLLGPSGCGKTTLLRIIAGLLEPTSGQILFDGHDVTALGTEKRGAVMCFQNYALWPHLTVSQNIGFGLTVQGQSIAQSAPRIAEMLKLVQLDALGDRKPNALSGGQQQRAALARALAVGPRCLLLDEPLSNLDAKLRIDMRNEIRRLCKAGGFTTIYVTHDQKEALSIADRIVVLNNGSIAQVGTPAELYHHPQTSFVADFLGQTNLIRGVLEPPDGPWAAVRTDFGLLLAANPNKPAGSDVVVSIRPERIRFLNGTTPSGPAPNLFPATVLETTFLGEASEHTVRVKDRPLRVTSSPPMMNLPAETLVRIDPADCIVLPE
jgi:ABC-type Fe3+/spermidine/putrescine transport system ATPase subunit